MADWGGGMSDAC